MASELENSDLANTTLLFIGEGNFSFTASLSALPNFPSLNCKLISTDYIPELKSSLECEATLTNVKSITQLRTSNSFNTDLLKDNVSKLQSRGHKVFLDVDATRLHEHKEILSLLGGNNENPSKILVIFNFPHVKSKKMKIGLNRDLLRDFFISCDKVVHILNNEKNTDFPVNVIPIVSLCAGQSGIPEVESVSRNWGDSWQINDMAAHGNFVCTKISKFTDWNLASMICSGSTSEEKCSFEKAYQSSYYRLQTGVSFGTENALTLTYKHACHVDPHKTDRLKTILRFNCSSPVISENNGIIADILRFFSPISEHNIMASYENNHDHSQLHYHHVLNCKANITKIVAYLKFQNSLSDIHVEIVGENVQVKTTQEETVVVVIGKVPANYNIDGDINMSIYLDQLLELKYNTDYRLLMCQTIAQGKLPSLYPHTHEFHISFWVNEDSKFSKNTFLKTLLDVYGLMLKSIHFVEEYQDKQGRKSLCWKIQVQSLDYPLSRLTSHQIYLQFRKELGERLNVEVR